ncbi:MAG: isopentenyl-diphosphate Delta-isomerase [Terrimonas sp.]|uniref:isopentenyl-diphosphate Delta-isomerase n=1 Tax=Terrimonas sp. TaxID=1914338 RepID=UPI000929F949|nr:isopentenyl-diphosphate Delta-isomerase [Terrimonas sp.]MBN8787277.1 isopentenyl-diphosphate Delta-isomerase [Terrimonas sp.]OJY87857.1 MAG: isopentenyl-diphosphate delta-isomerase [Sphingobacteriales bacterium 40-81]PVD52039.1 isopentenyl-diphosphate delta-isomerase [Terrimonas sp.]
MSFYDPAHEIILVNELDEQTGTAEKMEAHHKALLHRAFSVFIFNTKGEMLLQQRALSKYHSAGLWTNACCSHPRPGEETIHGAKRRLKEELGFTAELKKAFDFTYSASFDNGLTENEFDHVFTGIYDGPVEPNPEEVMDYNYKPMEKIKEALITNPQLYTAWFIIAFPKIEEYLAKR